VLQNYLRLSLGVYILPLMVIALDCRAYEAMILLKNSI